jgi:hypothetical protein
MNKQSLYALFSILCIAVIVLDLINTRLKNHWLSLCVTAILVINLILALAMRKKSN